MKLAYEGNWHSYEEWGGVRIYEDPNGEFYIQDGGCSVYSSPDEPEWGPLWSASFEVVLSLIDEWAAIEKENEEYWEQTYD